LEWEENFVRTIRDKVAVITGAGSGLGKAVALRLAQEGAHLHLLDINRSAAEAVADEARKLGVRAIAAQCDVADRAALASAVGELLAKWGTVDILVNNAGVAWYGPTHNMPGEQWERLLAINLHAPIHLTGLLLGHLLERPEAHVVNMASISGWVCGARYSAYHVSKFGLVGYSEALRAEYLRRGVGFTAVCPGPVLTNLYRDAPCGHAGRQTPHPPAWLCTTPEKVAQATVRAIYRNKAVTFISPMAHILYYTKRFAPWIFYLLHHAGSKRSTNKCPVATEAPVVPPQTGRKAA
jgi:NAD(P)-dependent dehydrogenase (short-subunit alcohol dehydrogenase family)